MPLDYDPRAATPVTRVDDDAKFLVMVDNNWKMVTKPAVQASNFSGIPVYNPYLTGARGDQAPVGNTDLFTVPAGKRAIVLQSKFYNSNASSRSVLLQVKIGGTYFPFVASGNSLAIAANTGSAAGTTANPVTPSFVFEAGDIIAMNCSGGNVNYNVAILVFDDTSPLKGARLTSLDAGANTLYTVPTGKNAVPCSINYTPVSVATYGFIAYAGATLSLTAHQVPSGETPAAGNQISATDYNTLLVGRVSLTTTNGPYGLLSAGDFINTTVTGIGSPTPGLLWTMVVEMPAPS